MNAAANKQTPYSTDELDDAAVWIARLHAPDRSAKVERGFHRWLAERPSHKAAFETISLGWELTGALQRRPFPKLSRWQRAGFRAGFVRAGVAVASLAAVAALGVVLHLQTRGVSTSIGEQRILTLEDGSRVSLNTASRLVVSFDEHERRVELKSGEALFEVAQRPGRPFVVVAGGRRIAALGTSFVVRDDGTKVAVTLLEGRVAVQSMDESEATAEQTLLTPGQRLTFNTGAAPRLDQPQLDKVTAWRRGQVEFEDAMLSAATDEINRYSDVKVTVERPEAAGIRINGVFRTGDIEGFAAAVARSYGLTAERQAQRIVLKGLPSRKALSEEDFSKGP